MCDVCMCVCVYVCMCVCVYVCVCICVCMCMCVCVCVYLCDERVCDVRVWMRMFICINGVAIRDHYSG